MIFVVSLKPALKIRIQRRQHQSSGGRSSGFDRCVWWCALTNKIGLVGSAYPVHGIVDGYVQYCQIPRGCGRRRVANANGIEGDGVPVRNDVRRRKWSAKQTNDCSQNKDLPFHRRLRFQVRAETDSVAVQDWIRYGLLAGSLNEGSDSAYSSDQRDSIVMTRPRRRRLPIWYY